MQHLLEKGQPNEKNDLLNLVKSIFVELSIDKFARYKYI